MVCVIQHVSDFLNVFQNNEIFYTVTSSLHVGREQGTVISRDLLLPLK